MQRPALLVCDVQGAFSKAVHEFGSLVRAAGTAVSGCATLGVPIVITEQYPQRLQRTVPELMSRVPAGTPVYSKTLFSMMTPEVRARLKELNVDGVILCGLEAHACVMQTAADLRADGVRVDLLVDAVSSQRRSDRAVAIQRMAQLGVMPTTVELALFSIMRDAKHAQFKTISALVKDYGTNPSALGTRE